MKQKYINAVSSHDLDKVRIMLADELFLDPRGITFSEMLKYAKENLPDLFEPNEAANYEFSDDRSSWNLKLASTIKQDLISNFSVEKLALFQEVAMEIGKDKAKALAEEENRERYRSDDTLNTRRTSNTSGSSSDKNGDNSKRDDISNANRNGRRQTTDKRTMGTISLCGGAALTIVGVCVEGVAQTLLCLVGGAAVVVGGIVLLSENKKM
jgi:hypothetical protein